MCTVIEWGSGKNWISLDFHRPCCIRSAYAPPKARLNFFNSGRLPRGDADACFLSRPTLTNNIIGVSTKLGDCNVLHLPGERTSSFFVWQMDVGERRRPWNSKIVLMPKRRDNSNPRGYLQENVNQNQINKPLADCRIRGCNTSFYS